MYKKAPQRKTQPTSITISVWRWYELNENGTKRYFVKANRFHTVVREVCNFTTLIAFRAKIQLPKGATKCPNYGNVKLN